MTTSAKKRRSFLSRHPRLKRIAYTIYSILFLLLAVATVPLRILPRRIVYWCAKIAAHVIAYPALRRQLDTNLNYAYGTRMTPRRRRAIGLKVVTNTVWSALDCYYLWVWWWCFDIRRIVSRVINRAVLEQALNAGNGALVTTGHYNCFEVMPVYIKEITTNGGVIARSFPSPILNWLFRRARLLHGIPSFFDEVKGVIKALRTNGVVGILPDLHARKRLGVPSTFYGKPTLTFDIHVRIASQMGCPMIPAFLMRHKRRPWEYTLLFDDAITLPRKASEEEIRATTQRVNDAIEWHIRRYPSGWIWFHNKWARW